MSGESPDEVNLSFMISMVKSIKPRDSIEAMLVAQMVSVHVMAMRCAHHLANADDLAQHDSAARALGRLARTFPAQIEALNRYRSHGEPAITVQNVSVGDGGKAIVGNVTQHARVIVSDKNPASAARNAPKASGSRRRRDSADAKREAQAERSHQQYRPDAGEPDVVAPKPVPAARAARRRCTARSAAACTAVHRDPARQGQTGTRASTACSPGMRSPSDGRFRRCWVKRGSCWRR